MDNFFVKYKRGIIFSLIVHCLCLFILLAMGLEVPDPPPPEKGILIDLGRDAMGKGEQEKKAVKKTPTKTSKPKQTVPVKTQVAKVDHTKKTPTKKIKTVKQLRQEIKNIDKQVKQVENKKQTFVPAPQKVNQNALFPGNSTSKGQGNTSGKGDMGEKTGIQDAKNYEKGEDLGAKNINYNLKGRSVVALYKPIYNSQEEGTVVMKITVNSAGKVTNAVFQERGSTTSNYALIQAAKKAALSTVFNSGSRAYQIGTITYTFVLQ
jgi:outer membrane biosynthesis protein TonB